MKGFPFDSQIIGYEENGMPLYDNASNAEEFASLIGSFLTNGVFGNGMCSVLESNGMNVTISEGRFLINGRYGMIDSPETVTFSKSDASNPRIDTVVLRMDLSSAVNGFVAAVVKGKASSSPSAPSLTRDGTVWELGIADVYIAANSTSVSQANITDTRLKTNRCGIVAAILTEVDTTRFYSQIQSDLESFKTVEKAMFDSWFLDLRSALGSDAAGNLYNLITEKTSTQGYTITLNKSNWVQSGDVMNQSVTISDLTGVSIIDEVIVTPAPTSQDAWGENAVLCTGYSAGLLTFQATSTPDANITVNVLAVQSGGFSDLDAGAYSAPPIVGDVIASAVQVSDAAARPTLTALSHIEAVQSGEGTPSPDNIRPISGWNSVRTLRSNENLISHGYTEITTNGITFTPNADGSVTLNGTSTAGAYMVDKNKIPAEQMIILPPGTYTVGGTVPEKNVAVYVVTYDKNGVAKTFRDTQAKTLTFTITDHRTAYVQVGAMSVGVTIDNLTVYPMLVAGDTLGTYVQPSVQILSAELSEIVYGGTVDWANGLLTVTHECAQIPSAASSWKLYRSEDNTESYFGFQTTSPISQKSPSNAYAKQVCSFLAPGSATSVGYYPNIFRVHLSGNLYLRLEIDGITSVDTLAAWLAANPQQVMWPLEAPYTIKLTPQQLHMLKGANTVVSSTGQTELSYIVDTKQYIDNKIAEMLASRTEVY